MPICTASAFFFFMLVEKNRAQRFFFFFNDPATTEIYTSLHTLSLHDALPISAPLASGTTYTATVSGSVQSSAGRSEEHTSELQSRNDISYAVFCLKKKKGRGGISPLGWGAGNEVDDLTGGRARLACAGVQRGTVGELEARPSDFFFLTRPRPPRWKRRYTRFPYTPLFR